jgi:hypothetical protein
VVTNDFYPKLGLPFKPYQNTDVDFSDYTDDEAENMVAPPAHNLWILTLGEVGIIGFTLFVAIWFRWMQIAFRFLSRRATSPMSRYGSGVFFSLLSLTLSTMTEYAYRFPQILFLVHILVGALMGLILGRKRAFAVQQAALRRRREERAEAAERSPAVASREAGL